MARAAVARVFNSIVLIGLVVFLAVGLTMLMEQHAGKNSLLQQAQSVNAPALPAAAGQPPF